MAIMTITPALAAFLSSCLEIGSEGSDGCGAGDEAEMEAACELVGELRSWADSGLTVQITFKRHEDDASGEPLDPQPFLDALDRGASKTLAGGVSVLDDGSLRSA